MYSYLEISGFLATANNLVSEITLPSRIHLNHLPIYVVILAKVKVFTKKHSMHSMEILNLAMLVSSNMSKLKHFYVATLHFFRFS